MDDEQPASKPDGSAWEAHMGRVNARNDAARKAGRAERAEQERSNTASLHAVELRQAAERRRHFDQQAGSGGRSRSGN
jgi:hypothetical protein